MDFIYKLFPDSAAAQQALVEAMANRPAFFEYYTVFSRIALCLLAFFIVIRCASSLLSSRIEPELWGHLKLEANGARLPINHWENLIGRSKSSDITINIPTVSRSHAALIRGDDGGWQITDLGSKGGTLINGEKARPGQAVQTGDTLTFAGVDTRLEALTDEEQQRSLCRTPPGLDIHPSITFYLLTIFQVILAFQLSISAGANFRWEVPLCFGFMIVLMWIYFIAFRIQKRRGFEIDIIAFFLGVLGLAVAASSVNEGMVKQFLAFVIGLGFFLGLGWFLRDLTRAKKMRRPMAAAAIGLLGLAIVAGTVVYGARNWIFIGGISIQPSEIAKVCFVYAGAATLDRLFAKQNIWLYLLLTVTCAAALVYTSDFGGALLFFVAFLVTAYLRSGDLKTILFVSAGAGFAGMIAIRFRPYILARFSAWMQAWKYPHSLGFQQTRVMSAAASGGFFGVGAGRGWLKRIPAADTDLVFGILSEELGLIVAICAVACICVLAVFAVKSTRASRSSFYSIAACTATAMFVFQMTLNVLGAVDILPLTGVTFPFVSNGGSSLVSTFGMLAFIKAADVRPNASFAIMPQKKIFRRRAVPDEKTS